MTRDNVDRMKRPSVAVIILTCNEAPNLTRALDSVCGWAEEVHVVDSYSTDSTVDRALERKDDRVHVVQHAFDGYSKQWNWALDHLPIRAEWTLKLDADEEVTHEFKREVTEIIARNDGKLEGISFRRRLVFLESILRWGSVSGNHDLRMWRSGKARFEERSMNEHAIVQGRTVEVRSFIMHHTCTSLSAWIDKHNRYSSLEARNFLEGNVTGEIAPSLLGSAAERRMWLRRLYLRLPARPFMYFLYAFFLRLGFLDGAGGFRFAFLHAAYYYWIDLKIRQYRMTGRLPEVIWPARGVPHPALRDSALPCTVDIGKAVGIEQTPSYSTASIRSGGESP